MKDRYTQTMKNYLTTTQKTEIVLAEGKSLLGITAKILSGSKALATAATHKDVTIIGDLMWENVVNPEEHKMDWHEAMEYAKNLRLGGYDDWRLPTIEELKAVVRECGGINVKMGNDDWWNIIVKNRVNESYQVCYAVKGFKSEKYWSSTTNSGYSNSTWFVDLFGGDQNGDSNITSNYVRCVRAGQ